MTAPVRISGPGELVASIPYLLGFTPEDSLVVMGLSEKALRVTWRVDLAQTDRPTLDRLIAALRGDGVSTVVLAVYPGAQATPGRYPYAGVMDLAAEVALGHGLEVLDALLVGDGWWWSYSCTDPACCPLQGNAIPQASRFVTEAIGQGVAPVESRKVIEDELAPRDTLSPAAVLWADASVSATKAAAGRSEWSPDDLANVAVTLASIPLRDELWVAQDNGEIDGRALWREVAIRAPQGWRAPAAFLFGWACWRAGDGARAHEAVTWALRDDPDYSAAKLLCATLDQDLRPDRMPRLHLPAVVSGSDQS